MYYDLITSLPQLPYFLTASRLPITPLRLGQRMRRLRPEHTQQLEQAFSLVRWRPLRWLARTDAIIAKSYSALEGSELETPLREYVAVRMEQQTLLSALRRKHAGESFPEGTSAWGFGPRIHAIRRHWDKADFGLAHVYPWLLQARVQLTSGDARGLERVLMDTAWRWLSRCAERNMFGFEAAFAYVFKWDILQSWLVCDADQARIRFTKLIDQVTNAGQP